MRVLVTLLGVSIALYFLIGETGAIAYDQKINAMIEKGPEPGDTVPVWYKTFKLPNRWSMEQQMIAVQQESFFKIFFTISKFPEFLSVILAACGASLLGYLIRLSLTKTTLSPREYYVSLLIAFITGLVAWILLQGMPKAFGVDDTNPFYLFAFSLLAGLCLYKFYNNLSQKLIGHENT